MQDDDSAVTGMELPSHLGCEHDVAAWLTRPGQPGPRADSCDIIEVNSNCFVCGRYNPCGLQLTFKQGSRGVEALWVPSNATESFPGTVHGGIITSVLDEAMSKAIMVRGWQAFTVCVNVRFHGRTSPGECLRVHGWVIERRKRRILTEANLMAHGAVERAHAWATFLIPGNSRLREPHA